MMRRALPHVALLALIGGLALLSWQALRVIARPPSASARRLQDADQILAYRVFADRGPRFLLDGGRARLKLSSFAVVPRTGTYDPALEISYGLRLRVLHDNRELWHGAVWTKSRQSKAEWDGRGFAREAAWSPDRVELADERMTIADLPEMPADAILEVRLLGDLPEARLRVFQAAPRDLAQRERAAVQWDDHQKAENLRSSTYVPWSLLGSEEKSSRLERRWRRLAARGNDGDDFTTQTVFVTQFRLPPASDDAALCAVSNAHAVAINVDGPAKLTVRPRRPVAFRVDTIGPLRTSFTSTKPLPIELPTGASTIVVSTTSESEVAFSIVGDQARWIVSPEQRAATPVDRLMPDRVRIATTMIGPTASATIPVRSVTTPELLGQVLRIDARLPLGSGDMRAREGVTPDFASARNPEVFSFATVTAVFRGRDGREIGRGIMVVAGTRAPFERLGWGERSSAVTEPFSFRVVAPLDASAVELSANRDVAIGMYRWLPGPQKHAAPYVDLPDEGLAWRYAPLELRAWYPLLPANHEQLSIAGRLAELDAQARLEPAEPAARWPSLGGSPPKPLDESQYQTLELHGLERQRARELAVLERTDAVIRAWGPGALSELHPGVARTLDFRADLATRPRISWAVPLAAIGRTAVVSIAGRDRTIPLYSRFGSTELRSVAAGVHAVSVKAPAGSQVWINRPPTADDWGIYRDRTLYAVRRPIQVPITKPADDRVGVYATFYVPEGTPPPRVRLTIDGGHPKRRAGVTVRLTQAEVVTLLLEARSPHPAKLVDLGGRVAGTPRVVSIALLDDLEPGVHQIAIEILSGGPAWLRLVVGRPGATPESRFDDDP